MNEKLRTCLICGVVYDMNRQARQCPHRKPDADYDDSPPTKEQRNEHPDTNR